jgi:hypothetical protein
MPSPRSFIPTSQLYAQYLLIRYLVISQLPDCCFASLVAGSNEPYSRARQNSESVSFKSRSSSSAFPLAPLIQTEEKLR